jgi:hypothetical protein
MRAMAMESRAAAPCPAPMQAAIKQVAQQTQVSTKDMGELFEYRISKPVTIKRKQSALVPIVSKDIKGKRVLLYEQAQHEKNPMACLEITNTAGVTLEQGPITIFYQENLAGEAMLPFLNQEETRLLSYALEQGVIVDKETQSSSASVHRVSFGGGYSYEYYYTNRVTTYKIQNKTERSHALYIDHPKTPSYEIYDTKLLPKDTPNNHRFSTTIEPKQNIKLVINERAESYSSYYIWDMNKKTLLENIQRYLSKKWIKPAEQALLTQVGDVLEKLNDVKAVLSKRQGELSEIFQEQDRLRKNLSSMSKTPSRSETELREKYVSKLDAQESRLEQIQAEIKDLQRQSDELSNHAMKSAVRQTASLNLQFKVHEMDDILKSLFVADLSGNGFISNISYDAAQDIDQMLKNISVSIPGTKKVLEDFLASIKGASVQVALAGKNLEGSVIGIETSEELNGQALSIEPTLVLLERTAKKIMKIRFSDMKSFRLLNETLQKDLSFLLESIISRKQKDAKNLAIRCEATSKGKESREIYLNYILEAPIWKTSYRLVLPGDKSKGLIPDGKALLSGWGLVENQTPNDWNDVDLSLVAGMPVTFKYPIYLPQFIQRKVVPLPTKSSIKPATIEDSFGDVDDGIAKGVMSGFGAGGGGRGLALADRAPAAAPEKKFEETFQAMKDAMQKSISMSAKDMGELFEYHIEKPVSIKRNQSALVPFLSREVAVKKVLHYDKVNHPMNPMACAEITNTSDLTLETGPITILIEDGLAGEAMLPFLNKNDTRMLNYALEQAVVVFMEQRVEQQNVHRLSLWGSYVYEYYYEDCRVSYTIKNKATTKKSMYLDHEKVTSYQVLDPEVKPTETPTRWRFSLDLEPLKTKLFKFTLRREISNSFYVWNINDDWITSKLAVYVKDKFITEKTRKVLEEIAAINAERGNLDKQRNDLNAERDALNSDQERLRENLKVLSDASMESTLKERLVKKLSQQENRYEEIKKEISAIEKQVAALNKKVETKFKQIEV